MGSSDRWAGDRWGRVDLGSGPKPSDFGQAPRRYRDREGKQPVLFSHRHVHRDQRRDEPCDVADPHFAAVTENRQVTEVDGTTILEVKSILFLNGVIHRGARPGLTHISSHQSGRAAFA